MAMDHYLQIDGVPGESLDKWHPGDIQVLSWSWGISHGPGPGALAPQSLSLTKYTDRATPVLLAACHAARWFDRATLVATRAGDRPLDRLLVQMQGVQVDSIILSGGGGDDMATESVTLRFEAVTLVYVAQNSDGSPGATQQTPRLPMPTPMPNDGAPPA